MNIRILIQKTMNIFCPFFMSEINGIPGGER